MTFCETVTRSHACTFVFILRDLFGWNQLGLDDLIAATGLSQDFLEGKRSMDAYKECMSKALYEKTEDFMEYSVGDSISLFCIVKQQVVVSNSVIQEILGINDNKFLFTVNNIPYTLGSLVNKYFMAFFDSKIFCQNEVFLLALREDAILQELSKDFFEAKRILDEMNTKKTLEEDKKFFIENPEFYEKAKTILKSEQTFKYMPYNNAFIAYLIEYSFNSNLYLNSLNSGGRSQLLSNSVAALALFFTF